MKAFLMFTGQDFDLERKPPWNAEALIQDLELTTLFNAIARGDEFLFEVAKSAVLSGLYTDLNTVLYRQNVLKGLLEKPFCHQGYL
jgi:hypothetical protein